MSIFVYLFLLLKMKNKDYIFDRIQTRKQKFINLGIREIGLFGSYVRNEQTNKSDIDILIDFEPEKETFDNFMAAYEILEKLFKGTKVEIVTKKGLSPYIGPKILNEVQYVQRAG